MTGEYNNFENQRKLLENRLADGQVDHEDIQAMTAVFEAGEKGKQTTEAIAKSIESKLTEKNIQFVDAKAIQDYILNADLSKKHEGLYIALRHCPVYKKMIDAKTSEEQKQTEAIRLGQMLFDHKAYFDQKIYQQIQTGAQRQGLTVDPEVQFNLDQNGNLIKPHFNVYKQSKDGKVLVGTATITLPTDSGQSLGILIKEQKQNSIPKIDIQGNFPSTITVQKNNDVLEFQNNEGLTIQRVELKQDNNPQEIVIGTSFYRIKQKENGKVIIENINEEKQKTWEKHAKELRSLFEKNKDKIASTLSVTIDDRNPTFERQGENILIKLKVGKTTIETTYDPKQKKIEPKEHGYIGNDGKLGAMKIEFNNNNVNLINLQNCSEKWIAIRDFVTKNYKDSLEKIDMDVEYHSSSNGLEMHLKEAVSGNKKFLLQEDGKIKCFENNQLREKNDADYLVKNNKFFILSFDIDAGFKLEQPTNQQIQTIANELAKTIQPSANLKIEFTDNNLTKITIENSPFQSKEITGEQFVSIIKTIAAGNHIVDLQSTLAPLNIPGYIVFKDNKLTYTIDKPVEESQKSTTESPDYVSIAKNIPTVLSDYQCGQNEFLQKDKFDEAIDGFVAKISNMDIKKINAALYKVNSQSLPIKFSFDEGKEAILMLQQKYYYEQLNLYTTFHTELAKYPIIKEKEQTLEQAKKVQNEKKAAMEEKQKIHTANFAKLDFSNTSISVLGYRTKFEEGFFQTNKKLNGKLNGVSTTTLTSSDIQKLCNIFQSHLTSLTENSSTEDIKKAFEAAKTSLDADKVKNRSVYKTTEVKNGITNNISYTQAELDQVISYLEKLQNDLIKSKQNLDRAIEEEKQAKTVTENAEKDLIDTKRTVMKDILAKNATIKDEFMKYASDSNFTIKIETTQDNKLKVTEKITNNQEVAKNYESIDAYNKLQEVNKKLAEQLTQRGITDKTLLLVYDENEKKYNLTLVSTKEPKISVVLEDFVFDARDKTFKNDEALGKKFFELSATGELGFIDTDGKSRGINFAEETDQTMKEQLMKFFGEFSTTGKLKDGFYDAVKGEIKTEEWSLFTAVVNQYRTQQKQNTIQSQVGETPFVAIENKNIVKGKINFYGGAGGEFEKTLTEAENYIQSLSINNTKNILKKNNLVAKYENIKKLLTDGKNYEGSNNNKKLKLDAVKSLQKEIGMTDNYQEALKLASQNNKSLYYYYADGYFGKNTLKRLGDPSEWIGKGDEILDGSEKTGNDFYNTIRSGKNFKEICENSGISEFINEPTQETINNNPDLQKILRTCLMYGIPFSTGYNYQDIESSIKNPETAKSIITFLVFENIIKIESGFTIIIDLDEISLSNVVKRVVSTLNKVNNTKEVDKYDSNIILRNKKHDVLYTMSKISGDFLQSNGQQYEDRIVLRKYSLQNPSNMLFYPQVSLSGDNIIEKEMSFNFARRGDINYYMGKVSDGIFSYFDLSGFEKQRYISIGDSKFFFDQEEQANQALKIVQGLLEKGKYNNLLGVNEKGNVVVLTDTSSSGTNYITHDFISFLNSLKINQKSIWEIPIGQNSS